MYDVHDRFFVILIARTLHLLQLSSIDVDWSVYLCIPYTEVNNHLLSFVEQLIVVCQANRNCLGSVC